ncbi:MAG: AGE family epimerase/isomerase [Armatimonadetes bacterium]|nr:AGE family epimerase/isomerase [Armatimonadota bacterium]
MRRYPPDGDRFGPAPLFPPHQALSWLLEAKGAEETRAALRVLNGMALGGVRDHLGGGFHRYSTDGDWHRPHFEKTLYDNALLLRAYALAWRASQDEEMKKTAEEIFEWLEGSMRDPAGGFYSAIDADSEGVEGRYYIWTAEEIRSSLSPEDARLVIAAYGVTEEGNYREEATGQATGANVLDPARPLEETAGIVGVPPGDFRVALDRAQDLLLQRRTERIPPITDDKILTSWNGLAIGSLAVAGQLLERQDMVERSRAGADFILKRMHTDGGLLHAYRQEKAYQAAFLDDYAYLVDGLIDLYEVTEEVRWLEAATRLADEMHRLFQDPAGGAYFVTSPDHDQLFTRFKSPHDSATPSANGVAARALLRLSRRGAGPRFEQRARAILQDLSGEMAGQPMATLTLMGALTLTQLPLNSASGKPTEGSQLEASGHHVRLRALAPEPLHPGRTGTVKLTLEIDKGWHINSHQPYQKSLAPTEVEARSRENRASVEKPEYPAGKERYFSFSGEPMSVYEGVVSLELPVRAGRTPGKEGAAPAGRGSGGEGSRRSRGPRPHPEECADPG